MVDNGERGQVPANRPTCVDVHFEDGTVRHMTLPEFDLYRSEIADE